MKRTAKILAIVLTMVLAFGAIAIVSSADTVAGVNVTAEGTFEGLDAGYSIDANNSANPASTGYDWQLSGRTGTVSVGVSADDSGNKYLIYQQSPKVGSSGPYFGTGYGGKRSAGLTAKTNRPSVDATSGVLSENGTDIDEWPFLVFDFDIMSPTGKWQGNVSLELRSFMAGDTTLDSVYYGKASQNPFVFSYDENGTYLSDKSGDVKMYVNPYEFTHVTLIWESVATETVRSVNLYVYVDGEYFFSYEGGNLPTNSSGTAFTAGYYNNTPHMSYEEVRINWPATAASDHMTAYDNVITRLFDTNYKGNLATVLAAKDNLNDWDASLYSEDTVPFGVAVAQVGDVKYDSLAKAIDAVETNGTVTLLANVADPVTVSKIVTINAGEYTAEIVGGEGYAVDTTTEGIYKVVNSAGRTVEVIWDECYCYPACEDLTVKHPLNYYLEEVAIFSNLYDLYNPTYTGYVGDDGVIYTLKGWKNTATDEMIDKTTTVTEEDVSAGYIDLEPVYEVATLDMTYIKDGKLVYVATGSGVTLANAVSNADAGSTITFMNDIDMDNTTITLSKAITIDLNGYTLKNMSVGKNVKNSAFKLNSGADITVKSSQVGGKIYCNGFNGSGAGSAGIFNINNNNTKVTLLGTDAQGNTSLTTFSNILVHGYSTTTELYIDGGVYVGAGSDNMGYIDLRCSGADATIKNATIYTEHSSGLINYSGRVAATDSDATVTVDNCLLIASSGVVKSLVSPVVVKITNSYIYGDVTPQLNSNYTSNTVGSVILGEGVYLTGKTNEYVTFVSGYALYDDPTDKDVTYTTLTWVIDKTAGDSGWVYTDDSFAPVVVNETKTFAKKTSNETPVTIIWKDAEGNEIGRNVALPGNTAVVPADMKTAGTLIPGWLDYVPAEWDKDLTVPSGVTEYVLTAVEGGAVTPIANVELLFNIRLTTHFEYHLFIPEVVEGIEITGVDFRGDRLARYNSFVATKYLINGANYTMVDAWPGFINGAAEDSTAGVTFTYGGNTYTVATTINMPAYCRYILETEGYSDDAKAVAANAANYLYTGCVLANNTAAAAKVADIVTNYSAYIIAPTDEELVAPDMSAIADYVSGVSLIVEAYSPRFKFDLTEAGKAATVKLSTGADSGTDTEYATLGYIRTNQTAIANLAKMTITVTPAEGEPVSAEFTLAGYVALLTANGADANTVALAKAMYGYAVANANY